MKYKNFKTNSYIDLIMSDTKSIDFSEELEDEMQKNNNLIKFISEIEIAINDFFISETVNLNIKIFFEEDWEDENIKKIILLLDFQDISFENELFLWKKLTNYIMIKINNLISYTLEDSKKDIIFFNKNFFIKLDLT